MTAKSPDAPIIQESSRYVVVHHEHHSERISLLGWVQIDYPGDDWWWFSPVRWSGSERRIAWARAAFSDYLREHP